MIDEMLDIDRKALIDGNIVVYDLCVSEENDVNMYKNNELFEYLGKGTIHSINGVKQSGVCKYDFFLQK